MQTKAIAKLNKIIEAKIFTGRDNNYFRQRAHVFAFACLSVSRPTEIVSCGDEFRLKKIQERRDV